MKLFKFEDYKLTISEEALLIKAFRDIWESDKSKDKSTATLELGVVYFMSDPRSDYSWIEDENEKLKAVIEQEGLPIKWKPSKMVLDAVKIYKELSATTASLLLEDTQVAINKVRKFLRELDLSEADNKGKPKYTVNAITGAIRDIPRLVRELADAEKAVTKEIEEQSRRKGNKTKSVTEDGYGRYL